MAKENKIADVCSKDLDQDIICEGCLADEIKIDFSLIPEHVKERLAAATFECVRSFLQQPGGREFLEARKKAKKKAALNAAN